MSKKKKYDGPYFTCQFGLKTTKNDEYVLSKYFHCAEKMYNKTLYFVQKNYYKMLQDKDYMENLKNYIESKQAIEELPNKIKKTKDKKEKIFLKEELKRYKALKKESSENLTFIRENIYRLSENNLQKYMNVQRKGAFKNTLDGHTVQKIASRVWKSAESVIFKNGKKFHFKHDELDSIESKSNASGIRFKKDTKTVEVNNLSIPIKIRKNDYYAFEALENEIAYCRIVRKPFNKGFKYFLQIVFKGLPPKKDNLKLGKGTVGIDQGTSTISAIGSKNGVFEPLAPSIDTYNKELVKLQQKINNSLRINNPNCYKKDGTIKKGSKLKKTKNCKRLIRKLKSLYRKKSIYIKQEHNKLAKKILALGDSFYTEEMNFRALQKKSTKPTEKSTKTILITKSDGTTKEVLKNKKKRRFGGSLNNHAPSMLQTTIEQKLSYFGKTLNKVNTKEYKASQYNHKTDEYEKYSLKERTKIINKKKVQRDLYSAFLIKNNLDENTINRAKCIKEFKNFLKIQESLIKDLKERNIKLPSCMGIKEF